MDQAQPLIQRRFGDAHRVLPLCYKPRIMRPIGDILYNFHWVVPGECARAAQAWAGGVGPFLEKRGIKALINLRGRNDDLSWWKNETGATSARGIAHLDAMLDSRRLPTRAMLVRLIEAFDSAPRPFVLKCSGGQDRTSFAAALYLIHRGGWAAMAEARGAICPLSLSAFSQKAAALAEAVPGFRRRGSPWQAALAGWIAESYTPERLKAWLEARGLSDSHAGIFLMPTRSPFQW